MLDGGVPSGFLHTTRLQEIFRQESERAHEPSENCPSKFFVGPSCGQPDPSQVSPSSIAVAPGIPPQATVAIHSSTGASHVVNAKSAANTSGVNALDPELPCSNYAIDHMTYVTALQYRSTGAAWAVAENGTFHILKGTIGDFGFVDARLVEATCFRLDTGQLIQVRFITPPTVLPIDGEQ